MTHRGRVEYEGNIVVPFPPESELSGVERITKKNDVLIYSREFNVCDVGGRLLLHFGAVDNAAEVYLNGALAGEHIGGYLPFTLDITELVREGENELAVVVTDALDKTYPYGKQRHRRGGMWYTPVSGIWQTVWLERVPERYIKGIKICPTLDSVTLFVEGGEREKTVILEGERYVFEGDSLILKIENPKLWSPEQPHLYRFALESGEDKIMSYFALREIGMERAGESTRLTLNGKPYFFHGLLDQGYFPDGIFTPASPDAYRDDILTAKSLGFNMLRKHIKIEPQIFYYYCDLYGIAVFQDMVNNGRYNFIYDTALPTVGFKRLPRNECKKTRDVFYETAKETLARLHNHPSVLYYTVFNEGWGQHNGNIAYDTLKPLDNGRIFDTASGWFGGVRSDVQSEHVYFKRADFRINPDIPCVLSEFGGYSCNIEGHIWSTRRTYGYKICQTPEELTAELEKLYSEEIIPLAERGLSAAVLTQLSDVEDETNGLITYDRRAVKVDKDTMLCIAERLKKQDGRRT